MIRVETKNIPAGADPHADTPAAHPEEELIFKSSPGQSIGVELELPILDKEDGQLVPGAPRILDACAHDGVEGLGAELMQSMLEVRTGVCSDVTQARQQIIARLARARNIAGSLGYDLALFGTHPFQRINASAVTEDPRYARIVNRLGWITYHRVAFGLHVHIGVSSGDQAVGLMNILVQYLPHLLALSANSPFWQGVDTGLASSRAVLYGLVAHSGVPPQFQNWRDFRTYCQVMRDCNALQSFKGIKWDIRPRPDLGTIEFRICDAPASLDVAMALSAIIRSLVISTRRLMAENPDAQRSDRRREWINTESRWLAARYGLAATYIRTVKGKRRALGTELAELVERLMPVARESGDHAHIMRILPIEKFETGAERQRALYREKGGWQALIRDSIDRLAAGLKSAHDVPSNRPATATAATGGAHV
ncbi:MAG TPA: YbdK family carboxylate-amine ligase [Phycisphaerales bacterium]|nr:YbdK family carboxylate-amine ligase [Phycisphaerales bacterium]